MFEYHVITIGRFTRNRYWGEYDTQAYRDVLCTTTLLKTGLEGEEFNILVDPSLPPAEMAKALNDRSGLWPDAIDAVFITHAHGDHMVGLELFHRVPWYMGEVELDSLRKSGDWRQKGLAERIRPATPGFIKGVELLPLPGHTMGTTAVLVDSADGKVAVTGDAVMTRNFFKARQGYYNSVDFEESSRSIAKLAGIADIVVPGHDNYFIAKSWN
jgi:glyoxylase-like metal-dependent hydrolase (beta-lactamase superfamily II)